MTEKQPERANAAFEDGLELTVSKDKMRATVEIGVENIDKWSPERLVRELGTEGVVSGVDKKKIDKLFKKKLFNQPVHVAFGTPAEDGKNGYVKHHIDVSRVRGTPKELASGGVDLKDIGVFTVIAKDQLLAELMPPTAETVGKDVYGAQVDAKPGKEAKLSGGKGTRLSADGKNLHADTDGILEGSADKIAVNPALVVQGDVSYGTGNIDGNVSVAIGGNVLAGFSVKSKEDICISGVVEAAEITSEKNIVINAGIQGDNRAVLTAGGMISAVFANEAKLIATEGVFTKSGITHCEVNATGIVETDGERGVIVGGDVNAGIEIAARTIGSELGAATSIQVGPDMAGLERRAKELGDQRKVLEANLEKLQEVMTMLQSAQTTGRRLPAHQLRMAQEKLQSHGALAKQMKEITEQEKELRQRVTKERDIKRYIRVKDTIWPGVTIRIMNASMTVKNPMKAVLLTFEDREIKTYAYRERGVEGPNKEKIGSN